MDLAVVQVSASLHTSQGFVTSAHLASAVTEALHSCAISIPGKTVNKLGGCPDPVGSPPRSIDSLYQAPLDVTAPPPTRRGTLYSRPRSAPTITKSRKRTGTRKVTGGGSDDESGYDERLSGGEGGDFFSNGGGGSGGGSGGRWGGGNWGSKGGGRSGDDGRGEGQGAHWSGESWQWLSGGCMNQGGADALCSLYYRSLCWISLTRCVYHVLTSQFMLEGAVATRPSLARCSAVFERQGSRLRSTGAAVIS